MNQELEGHTMKRFDQELGQIHMMVLEMGGLIINQLQNAMQALENKDIHLAQIVARKDREVGSLEINTDQKIFSLLARRNPVARDLRAVMAFSKILTDLEQIGDNAVKVAKITQQIYGNGHQAPSDSMMRDIDYMGTLAVGMLQESMEAFDRMDAMRAEVLAAGGSEMDLEFQDSIRRLSTYVMEDARNIGHTVRIVLIMKALERVGDHARNVAEYVIYMVKGEDIRHRYPDKEEDAEQS